MADYFFLMSSLPMLKWGEPPPMTAADLLKLASGHIDENSLTALREVSAFPPYTGNRAGAAKSYANWDTALRNALLTLHGADGARYARPEEDCFSELRGLVQAVAGAEDPLTAEKLLDEARFRAAEPAPGGGGFGFDALCAYKIKLELLEKYTPRTPRRGEENLDRILATFNVEPQ